MEKILLAVGFRQLEEFLEKQLKNEFLFVGTTVYREGIIRSIGQKNPNIVIIRETLDGKENILSIIYEIRTKFPKIRVVFIAGKREPGDALLATLVNYGVYDILQGEKIQAQEVVALIRKPNEYKSVQHLQPVPVLDEQRNEVLFQSPSAIVQEREVIREVYIEQSVHTPSIKTEKEPPIVNVEKQEQKEVLSIEELPIPTERAEVKKEKKEKKEKKVDAKKEVPKESTNKTFLDKLMAKPEITSSIDEKMISTSKQKIITFMGSKSGVGNSSLAFNTALTLAQRGLKTIYLEFNDKTPAVSYWYELGFVEDGIDSALIALENSNFEKVDDAIVKSADLKKSERLMKKNYRKFPNTLDFMFFSNRYLTRESGDELEKEVNLGLSKELFLYLMFQLEYDYIILDVPADIHNETTANALVYSSKVFMTLTQDVSTIGYSIYKMNELSKKGVNVTKKLHYILNQFEKADLSLKEIEDWIQTENILTVPMLNKEFVNANFLGLPVALYSKNAGLRSSLQEIEKTII